MRQRLLICLLVLAACSPVLAGCSQHAVRTGAASGQATATAEVTSRPATDAVELARAATTSPATEGSTVDTNGPDADGKTAVDAAIARLGKDAGGQGNGLSGAVVAAARDGDQLWVHVRVTSSAGGEAEQVFLSRKLAGGAWQVRTYGTGVGPGDLASRFGVSEQAAQTLFGH